MNALGIPASLTTPIPCCCFDCSDCNTGIIMVQIKPHPSITNSVCYMKAFGTFCGANVCASSDPFGNIVSNWSGSLVLPNTVEDWASPGTGAYNGYGIWVDPYMACANKCMGPGKNLPMIIYTGWLSDPRSHGFTTAIKVTIVFITDFTAYMANQSDGATILWQGTTGVNLLAPGAFSSNRCQAPELVRVNCGWPCDSASSYGIQWT